MNIILSLLLFFMPMTEYIVSGSGSMNPTFKGGEVVETYHSSPKVDDIIVFECGNFKKCHSKVLIKRIKKIDNYCYFVEGDNQPSSWDSNDYGWLCGNEIRILGVVKNVRHAQSVKS